MTKREKELYLEFINYCIKQYEKNPDGSFGYAEGVFQGICEFVAPFCGHYQKEQHEFELLDKILKKQLPPTKTRIPGFCWDITEEGVIERINWLENEKEKL